MADMPAIDRDEFRAGLRELRDDLRADIRGVHDRLDELNGRTRRNETDVAVLEERVQQAHKALSASSRWWTHLTGSAIAAAVAGLIAYVFGGHAAH